MSSPVAAGRPGRRAFHSSDGGLRPDVDPRDDRRGAGTQSLPPDPAPLAQSARLYALEHAAAFASQQPIERLIEPDEVATIITFLAGPNFGAITGADHAVD